MEFLYPPNTGVVTRNFWELLFVEQKMPSGETLVFTTDHFRKVCCLGSLVSHPQDRFPECSWYLDHAGREVPPCSCSLLSLACRAGLGWEPVLEVGGGWIVSA